MVRKTSKIVREATLDDEQRLRHMQAASLHALGACTYDRDTIDSFIAHVGTMERQMLEDGSLLIIKCDHRIVACGGWTIQPPVYHQFSTIEQESDDEPHATIRSVYVDPGVARLGYGSQIMQTIEDQIYACDIRSAKLAATANGVPFYQKLGYARGHQISLKLPCGRTFSGLAMHKRLMRPAHLAA